MTLNTTLRIIIGFLLILDGVTTYIGITKHNATEANVLARYVMENIGVLNTCIITRMFAFVLLFHVAMRGSDTKTIVILSCLVVLLSGVQFNNFYKISKLKSANSISQNG